MPDADIPKMRLPVASVVLLLALVSCGGESGTYDKDAREAAVRAVGDGPFNGVGEVSVGAVREREECPQAPSPEAGPCLAVDVATEVPLSDTNGEPDPLGRSVEAEFDFFVWLTKDDQARWVVTHSTYRPKGVPDELG
jgi:hypothetical protein